MKILITGMSGTGKTTLMKYFKEKGYDVFGLDEEPGLCNFVNKDTGEIFSEETTLNKSFIDQHDWVCNISQLEKLLMGERNIFVFGSADNLEDIVSRFDKVFLLHVEPKVFLSRIEGRTDNDFGKHPEIQNHILETYEQYENNLKKLGAIPIYTGRSLKKVYEEIISCINQ